VSLARSGEEEAGRWGRRIAAAIYWVGIAYIVVVGFRSIIPAVFWPGSGDPSPPTSTAPASAEWCRYELEQLKTTLVDRAVAHIRAEDSRTRAEADRRTFFSAWDRRWGIAGARCDSPALGTLERLRYQIETTLYRFDRQEGALLERLHAQLDAPQTLGHGQLRKPDAP